MSLSGYVVICCDSAKASAVVLPCKLEVALHSAVHNRFVLMNGADMATTGHQAANTLPSSPTAEAFVVRYLGNGDIALHNTAANNFVRMTETAVDGCPHNQQDSAASKLVSLCFALFHKGLKGIVNMLAGLPRCSNRLEVQDREGVGCANASKRFSLVLRRRLKPGLAYQFVLHPLSTVSSVL